MESPIRYKHWKEHEQATILYDKALGLYDQQQYAESLALLGQALPFEPDRAYLYYARGNARAAMNDVRGAAAEYLCALRRAPYHFAASINLGCMYQSLGRYEKSLAQFQHALHLRPDSAIAHANVGTAYLVLSRLPEALAALNQAIEMESASARTHLNRANTLSRLGMQEEAIIDYRQALMLQPEDSLIAWTSAWAQFGTDGLNEVQVRELERITGLDPAHYSAHCCMAVLAYHHNDPRQALQRLELVAATAPMEWDPHFWIGFLMALNGEAESARSAIEDALELGLPPLLLTPLSWLKRTRPKFYNQYVCELFQHYHCHEL